MLYLLKEKGYIQLSSNIQIHHKENVKKNPQQLQLLKYGEILSI